MALSWFSLVIHCEHPALLADFWCAALNFQVVYRSDNIVDIAADSESYPGIEFIRSESYDDRKSPLHIDLNPDDQAEEVARLVALGEILGLAACSGDGDVVLPSDTKPPVATTTVRELSCADVLATTTTRVLPGGGSAVPLVACSER